MKNLIYALALLLGTQCFALTPPNKILVVLSSENKITLKNRMIHSTGFFLSELMVPLQALQEAGFQFVFADPLGNAPTLDPVSDNAFWFGGDQIKYMQIKKMLLQIEGLQHPRALRQIRRESLSQFAGIFIPGGHAPMEDLSKDKDLGIILRYFHTHHKPTALICHGPIALLSTISSSQAFQDALESKSIARAEKLAQDFPYRNYRMTAFSTKEEQQEELGQDAVLGGFVKFYPDEALGVAGGNVKVNALKWKSNVQVDRELITGQNPFSDEELANKFIVALMAAQSF